MNLFVIDPTILFFALSFLSALSRLYKRQVIHKEIILPSILFLLISTLMITGLIFNVGNDYAYDKTVSFIIITGWSFFGAFFLTDSKDVKCSLKRYISTFLVLGLIMTTASFFNDQSSNFTAVFGSNYLALGKMAAITGLILFTYLVSRKIKLSKFILILILFILTVYVLLISGGRMPVISFLICLIVIIVSGLNITGMTLTSMTLTSIKIKKKSILFGMIGLVSLPFIINMLASTGNLFFQRFMLIFNGGGDSANSRYNHIQTAFRAFSDTNTLGLGSGGYMTYINSTDSRAYPHNILLESMAELGLLGLMLTLSLIVIAIFRYFKYHRVKNFYSITLFVLFLYSLLNAMTSGDFNDNRVLFFFIALLSMSRVLIKSEESNVLLMLKK